MRMKTTILLTMATLLLTMGLAPRADARHERSTVYISGYRSCGTPIYAMRYWVGYDRCGRPIWKYRVLSNREYRRHYGHHARRPYCGDRGAYGHRPSWHGAEWRIDARF